MVFNFTLQLTLYLVTFLPLCSSLHLNKIIKPLRKVAIRTERITICCNYNNWNNTKIAKIGLYSCCVSQFSLEIFGSLWYVNNSTVYVTLHNFLRNQEDHWLSHKVTLNCACVCMYPLALNQKTFEPFNGIISNIYLISLCSVTYAVELFTYQTNPNISRLKWDTRQLYQSL